MRCPKCNAYNPARTSFCKHCETPLLVTDFEEDEFLNQRGSYTYQKPQYPYPPQSPTPNPYPYPYPYPQHYPYPPGYPYLRPSIYGDLYNGKPKPSRIRFDVLFKVLYNPKGAFIEIYHNTTKNQGLMLVLILAIFYGIIQMIILGTTNFWSGNYSNYGSAMRQSIIIPFITIAVSIPMALVTLYLTGYFGVKLFKRSMPRANVDKTIGLMGYAYFVGVVIGIITQLVLLTVNMNLSTDNDMGYVLMVGGISFMFVIISFIWSLWVNGYAVSVANDVTLGNGILYYFVASIVVGLIVLAIMLPILFLGIFI